jgi:hypothetical protein
MKAELAKRRRVLIDFYTEYLVADRAWTEALDAASELVPDVVGHGYWRLGEPRSRLRRLYLERDNALRRMMVARMKLKVAKQRLEMA